MKAKKSFLTRKPLLNNASGRRRILRKRQHLKIIERRKMFTWLQIEKLEKEQQDSDELSNAKPEVES